MDYKEIKTKSREDLMKLVRENQETLRQVRFGVAHGEEKDVRKVRELRKTIAQVLTFLHKTK
ncbi:MAG: 50S ribosomal protein L29 [bacterium]|nr:50S ribosomal protein L29 [bacterium]